MKHSKRIFITCITFLLVTISVFQFNAATIYIQDGYSYTDMEANNISLCGWDNRSPNLVIPNKLGNYYFAEVADFGLRGNTGITSLDVTKATVFRRIGMYAFADCTELRGELVLPLRITEIGQSAFENCYQIEKVKVYSNINTIEAQTFYNCASLTSIELPTSLKSIEALAFANCSSLKRITIPASVQSISKSAFNGINGIVIQGYRNSYAEKFAKENGYDFYIVNPLMGDANGDYTVDISDVTYIQKYLVGVEGFDPDDYQYRCADVNADGEVTLRDATQIQKYLAGIISAL